MFKHSQRQTVCIAPDRPRDVCQEPATKADAPIAICFGGALWLTCHKDVRVDCTFGAAAKRFRLWRTNPFSGVVARVRRGCKVFVRSDPFRLPRDLQQQLAAFPGSFPVIKGRAARQAIRGRDSPPARWRYGRLARPLHRSTNANGRLWRRALCSREAACCQVAGIM